MRQSIRFLLGDEIRELRDFDPTETVLEYLRLRERRVGTKEGCAEGDCGACTVVVGSLKGDKIEFRAVNSCIQFMPSLEGRQLITVEDLKTADGILHPVQQAMVDEHGSQCGFCTPGFVMSLFALYQNGETTAPPDLNTIDDALAGNLCRCTGYGPIISAARTMHEYDFRGQEATDGAVALLKEIQSDDTIRIDGPDGRTLYAPTSSDQLTDLLAEHPDAVLVAGATDVGLWVTKAQKKLDPVIYLGRIQDMQDALETEDSIEIGAVATYATAAPLIARHYPAFGEILRRLGSVQVRNLGTIGGNIANGSPIGDTPPPLIALGATLTLRNRGGRRTIPLENFFLSYGKQDLAPGEFVETVHLPKPAPENWLYCAKVSKRFDQDISALLGAFNLRIEDGKVSEVRIAFGGMAEVPKRAHHTEAALLGKPWTMDNVDNAVSALTEDFAPIDDQRASAGYRLEVAGNLLRKAYLDSKTDGLNGDLLPRRRVAHG